MSSNERTPNNLQFLRDGHEMRSNIYIACIAVDSRANARRVVAEDNGVQNG
jgi:hypothetical protein